MGKVNRVNQERLDLLEDLALIAEGSQFSEDMKITRTQALVFGSMVVHHVIRMREENGELWFGRVFDRRSNGKRRKKTLDMKKI